MKQHITPEQLEGLTIQQKLKLVELTGVAPARMQTYIEETWRRDVAKAPTIGKMVEILGNKIKHIDRTTVGWEVGIEYVGVSMYREYKELTDALWQALLATL